MVMFSTWIACYAIIMVFACYMATQEIWRADAPRKPYHVVVTYLLCVVWPLMLVLVAGSALCSALTASASQIYD